MTLGGCATPEVTAPEPERQYWSMSRTVESELGMVTLFDPTDLVHHESDPPDWYRYDFAFANDLETGRFAAVMTDRPGRHHVRVTTGPLTADEQLTAGPQATMRLRVINYRLLLTGGDAWPSNIHRARSHAYDPRWIPFDNGDYQVIITALDRQLGARHDLVFQLLPVGDMQKVLYAPGVPYLVVGKPPGVTGLNSGGLSYREACGKVPSTAAWSALTSATLPLPGSKTTVNLAASLHERGLDLQSANRNSALPVVIARNPVSGSIGILIKPEQWRSDAIATNGEVPVTTQVLCAVKVNGVEPGIENFALQITALPGARDPIPRVTLQRLTQQFENWIRLSGDPAWRFKSAQIQRTRDPRSVMLGIMDYLTLSAKHTESLLQETNAGLASRLLEHMSITVASTTD